VVGEETKKERRGGQSKNEWKRRGGATAGKSPGSRYFGGDKHGYVERECEYAVFK